MTRIVFQMVSGRQLYNHPSRLHRGYVMDKLLTFLREHNTPPAVIVRDLIHASEQLPKSGQPEEGVKLQEAALKARRSRQKGPQEQGTLLVAVPARLGIAAKDDDAVPMAVAVSVLTSCPREMLRSLQKAWRSVES